MRLDGLTWVQAQEYFKKSDLVVLATGSIEGHGKHLPLGTDAFVPASLLDRVDEKCSVLTVPPLPYGSCDYLENFPGTISLGPELHYRILERITSQLYHHGARKFVVINGHGGNKAGWERVGFSLEDQGALVALLNWWEIAGYLNPAWKGGHGGAEETSAIMSLHPTSVDLSYLDAPNLLVGLTENLSVEGFRTVNFKGVPVDVIRKTDSVTTNGWLGKDHPLQATQEWGTEMLSCVVDFIVDFIKEFDKISLSEKES